MFDLGWPELLVIAIVLIVVVGPKDLPRVLRSFGRTTTKLRSMAGDFRKQFDEALREAELDDVKSVVDDARKLDPRSEIRKHLSPLEEAGRDVRAGLDKAMKPKPSAPAESPAVTAKAEEPKKTGATALPGEKAKAGPPAMRAAKPAAKKAPDAKTKKAPDAKSEPAAKPAAPKPAAKTAARRKKTTGTAS